MQYSGQGQCAASIWSIAKCKAKILEPLVLSDYQQSNTCAKEFNSLVEDVAEAIASYQNHRYYIASNIGMFLLYTSGTPTPPHLGPGQILLRILLQYCWSLAISLLSYYYCVFWQMQLLRFSYFSKFQYYIDVLNIQKKSDFFAKSQRGWLQCGIV